MFLDLFLLPFQTANNQLTGCGSLISHPHIQLVTHTGKELLLLLLNRYVILTYSLSRPITNLRPAYYVNPPTLDHKMVMLQMPIMFRNRVVKPSFLVVVFVGCCFGKSLLLLFCERQLLYLITSVCTQQDYLTKRKGGIIHWPPFLCKNTVQERLQE